MILRTIKKMFGMGSTEGITCEEALARIYEYMDGELEAPDAAAVEAHFRMCTACYPYLKLEEDFRARVQIAMTRPEVPQGLRDRVLRMLAEEGDATD